MNSQQCILYYHVLAEKDKDAREREDSLRKKLTLDQAPQVCHAHTMHSITPRLY